MDSLALRCGPVDAGWSSFELTLGEEVFACEASYLGLHPLCQLVPLAVELHLHYFHEPWAEGAPDAEVEVVDEPGGFRLLVRPLEDHPAEDHPTAGRRVRLRVFSRPYMLLPVGEEPRGELLWSGSVPLEDLLREIHRAAGRMLARHGFLGFRLGWRGWRWGEDETPGDAFPLDHYLYLGRALGEEDVRGDTGLRAGEPTLAAEAEVLTRLLRGSNPAGGSASADER